MNYQVRGSLVLCTLFIGAAVDDATDAFHTIDVFASLDWRIWPPRGRCRLHLGYAALTLLLCLAACEDDIELPPDDSDPADTTQVVKPLDVDVQRIIFIKADVSFSIPNLIFVVQEIPGANNQLGLTLTATRPAADGARLTFGTFQSDMTMDTLAGKTLSFASGSIFNPMSNGITTRTAHYQPKFAEIKVASVDQTEIRGRLSGDFYRFSLTAPGAKPTVVKAEGDFVALLYKK